jgi:large subunit ribosomal protein L35
MPKMKSKSGAKKRFQLTGTGKVKRKRNLQKSALIAGVDEKAILLLLK